MLGPTADRHREQYRPRGRQLSVGGDEPGSGDEGQRGTAAWLMPEQEAGGILQVRATVLDGRFGQHAIHLRHSNDAGCSGWRSDVLPDAGSYLCLRCPCPPNLPLTLAPSRGEAA